MTEAKKTDAPNAPTLALSLAGHPATGDAIEPGQFADTMANLPAAVTVVTAWDQGVRHGRTVTSIFSLSPAPPSVLISITRDTALAQAIENGGRFSLSLLAADQQAVANSFAGRGPSDDRFDAGTWTQWASGQPRLEGAATSIECTLAGAIETETHIVFAGIVVGAARDPDRAPLIWHRRDYAGLAGPDA